MRIVAGLAKGRRLAAPAAATRPTSDRAREALFNSLAALLDLEGTRVLDLFAGTGAVGLEALSRGAAEAVFVETDRAALQVLGRNIATVGLPGAQVVGAPVAAFLAGEHVESSGPFHLVFADPPYAFDDGLVDAVLTTLAGAGWLDEDAVVVIERGARGAAPSWPDCITPLREKRYGEGVLWYGRRR